MCFCLKMKRRRISFRDKVAGLKDGIQEEDKKVDLKKVLNTYCIVIGSPANVNLYIHYFQMISSYFDLKYQYH